MKTAKKTVDASSDRPRTALDKSLIRSTSNLVNDLGLELSDKKIRLGPKLAGVWARGASRKNLGPPTYFCNR